ncbi:pro-Pol polyprotein [Trichonephila clavipes]|nr:pro-Pol polyprotein [Trichonephila clavipes]
MNRCPDLVVCLKRDLQCLRPEASLVLIYRPNVAGMKGRVDLVQPVNRTPDLWNCNSPARNGQVGRYNGIIWKTIQLALRSNSMKTEQWERVIQTALHSIRSSLCTATNATPHERMFSHPRGSHNGLELIEANPDYAHVKLGDGRETTVSIRHLTPRGETTRSEDNKGAEENVQAYPDLQPINLDSTEQNMNTVALRTTSHHRQPPAYLKDYIRD